MSFHEILVQTGGFGVYQKFLAFGCLSLSLSLVSLSTWTQIFILLIPPHRCKIHDNDTQWILRFNETRDVKSDQCHFVFNGNQTPCSHGVIYDFSLIFPTYTSEHDLVCDKAWKTYLVHTIYWAGTIFGYVVFGIIADKFGRRRAYQCSVLVTVISDVMTLFCDEFTLFMMARFCSAAGVGSIGTSAFVLAIEHIIPSKRKLGIFVWSSAFSLASLSIVWISYFLFNWRHILMIAWILPIIALVISYFLPESPSWLLTKGRVDEAVEYIQRMARINGKPVTREFILQELLPTNVKEMKEKELEELKTNSKKTDKLDSEKERELSCCQTVLTVLKSPNLRKRIACLGFLWMTSCACYSGNNLEFQNLPFNLYISYSIGALIEIPANILVMLSLDRIGRRWANSLFFIIGGVFGILSANVTNISIMLTLVIIMRACFSSAYDIMFSSSSELIPTVIRGRVISIIRMLGGIGGVVAPFIVSLAQKDPLLPLSCFGIAAIISGLLVLTLPETAHQQLPHTIEEAENYGRGQSFWHCPCLMNQTEEKSENWKGNSHLKSFENQAFETDETEIRCLRIKKLPKY